MNITIIGSGYVGLVTGACFSQMGNHVICVDSDIDKINKLNNGESIIYEENLDKKISDSIKSKCINFTSDIEHAVKSSDIIFIAVGTPIKNDGSCNLDNVYKVADDIGRYINQDKIIVVKSTVPVGTTFKIEKKIIDGIKKRNKNLSFSIAHNPEFLKQGKAVNDFMSPDRIVVGLEENDLKSVFKELYKPFSINHEKLIFMDILSSELTKYAANAMLSTKISFINEMSIIADIYGADINKIRIGVGSDSRIGYNYIYPSIGYGGSCLSKDIDSLINSVNQKGYNPEILNAVQNVNLAQRKYFLDKIVRKFKGDLKHRQLTIWGLSYKPGTDDMRDAASVYIVNKLIKFGAIVNVYDPKSIDNAKYIYFKDLNNVIYSRDKYKALENSDALILLTEWPEFRSPDFEILKSKLKSLIIFDGKNQYDEEKIKNLGFEYYKI